MKGGRGGTDQARGKAELLFVLHRHNFLIDGSGLKDHWTSTMADKRIYVEKRPNEGDFAVRKPGAERASAIAPTQKQAIEIARKLDPGATPHVERVRDTSVGGRDKWRKP
jgi:hypothetical protein